MKVSTLAILALLCGVADAQPKSFTASSTEPTVQTLYVTYGALSAMRESLVDPDRSKILLSSPTTAGGARLLEDFIEEHYVTVAASSVAFLCIEDTQAFFQMAKSRQTAISKLDWNHTQRVAASQFVQWYQKSIDDIEEAIRELPHAPVRENYEKLAKFASNPMISSQELLEYQAAFAADAAGRPGDVASIAKTDAVAAKEITNIASKKEDLQWYTKKQTLLHISGKELSDKELDWIDHQLPSTARLTEAQLRASWNGSSAVSPD